MIAVVVLLSLVFNESGDSSTSVPAFHLTERNGRPLSNNDLRGKVWIASFVMTRCPDGKCPQVAQTVKRLQDELASRSDVRLVTFTSDPERDDPEELKRYAESHGADPSRWLFLTGEYDQIDALMRGLYLRGGEKKQDRTDHSQKIIVIGRDGNIVGYFDGLWNSTVQEQIDFERNLLRLRRAVDKALIKEHPYIQVWMPRDFPAFNAFLNGLSCVLLLVGYASIKSKLIRVHIFCMLTTIGVSALFLASYLFFHIIVKEWRPTRFAEQAPDAPTWVGIAYAILLLSHTLLAVIATPMALVSAYFGLRKWWSAHIKLARWTFPVWFYVSVTGVAVYWMLYCLYPAP
ncbi:MAG: DUF420 domain-containing protein [Planctomycetia bacterium]|nr:DUF420 domain-containing protein [Planctomycetia bacterium]